MDASNSNGMKPNDVAIIFRPNIVEGKRWDGDFGLMITGIGPVTMNEEDFTDLVNVAMTISAFVPLIEEDKKLATLAISKLKELDVESTSALSKASDDSFVLNKHTRTVGGMQ